MRWLRRFLDWHLTARTRRRLVDRECPHDDSDPLCWDCTRAISGW